MAPQTTKPWADGPFELIPFSKLGYKKGEKVRGCHEMAEEMILVHNGLLRGINSVYLQCVNVQREPAATVAAFVDYAAVWGQLVHEHHDGEEAQLFPSIEALVGEPGLMAGNVAQHAAFHDGLERYSAYLDEVRAGTRAYDGEELLRIIDGFAPVLHRHLMDEIDTLLALERFEGKVDFRAWYKEVVAEAIKEATKKPEVKYTVVPFAMQCHDATFGDGAYPVWPAMPWIARLLFDWLFAPRHKDWWQFAPSDTHGRPKELPFA